MKTVHIIIIGDEILNGQTKDSNSYYLAHQLNLTGLTVKNISVINDEVADIRKTFQEAMQGADVIIATGGLGPTKDDITKSTLAGLFNCEITYNQEARQYVEEYVQQRNMALDERNQMHAYIPEKARALKNEKGMAPGLLFDENDQVTIALPGVPPEMEYLTDEHVIPYLEERFALPATQHKHYLTVGIREIILHEKISEFTNLLPDDIGLAFLPSWGMVKLRLTARGYSETAFQKAIEPFANALHESIGSYIYGYDGETLSGKLGQILKDKDATLATAESCTGGFIAHLLTSISGSSNYYLGGIVSYANEIKMRELGVAQETLQQNGAVSEPVVRQMVKGLVQKFGTDYGIATSGVAGPYGGSPEKPVGTVWVAAGNQDHVATYCFHFFKDRYKNIYLSGIMGLDMLRRFIQYGEVDYPREESH